jgi:AcrR family transcriptional regulator
MSGRLSRTRIVEAATKFIDTHGPESLTMRRLGSCLGVEAMALYRHVNDKEHLLAAVVERLVDEVLDDPRIVAGSDSWEEYLRTVAHAMRGVETDHPRAFPLIATRPPEAPYLRPPLRSVRWVEHFLSSLLAHGFSHHHAVRAYKAFTSFLLGALLLEAASSGAQIAPVDAGGRGKATAESPTDHPTVVELADLLSADSADFEFSEGLDSLIERIRIQTDEGSTTRQEG